MPVQAFALATKGDEVCRAKLEIATLYFYFARNYSFCHFCFPGILSNQHLSLYHRHTARSRGLTRKKVMWHGKAISGREVPDLDGLIVPRRDKQRLFVASGKKSQGDLKVPTWRPQGSPLRYRRVKWPVEPSYRSGDPCGRHAQMQRRELYAEQTSLLEFALKMKQAEAYARFDGAKRNLTCLGHLSLGPSLKVGKFNQRSLLREQFHQTLSHQ